MTASYGFGSFGGGRRAAGQRRSATPISFLNNYIQSSAPTSTGFTPVQTNVAPIERTADEFLPQATSSQGTQSLAPGDIGFGLTPGGNTIVDSNGSYSGFIPKIENRDGQWYVEDNRGYGPFKGKMHKVSPEMAKMQQRKAAMGMTRYLMPHPNPEQFAQTTTAGGITGTMTPSYVTGGGTIWNPQFSFTGALTPKSYNEWATAFQTQRDPNFDPMSKAGSETVTSNYDISKNPAIALRMGMPINRMAVAEDIARRRGTGIDEDVLRRADWRIGSQLYRKNVAGGFAEPGTYARQGGGIPKGSTWSQVSRGNR